MKNSTELRAELAAYETEVRELADLEESTPEADARLDELVEIIPALRNEIDRTEKREQIIASARVQADIPELRADFHIQTRTAGPADLDVRTADVTEIRDVARKSIDEARWLTPTQQESVEKMLDRRSENFDGALVARQLVVSERPEYRSAFQKGMAGVPHLMTEDERRADAEFRAMSTTTTAGGFGIPVLIDPTVLTTDGTGLLNILPYMNIQPITNNVWKGVSAGHTAWSFDAESAEVSDDASTFAQPTVTAHKAQALIPYSIEIEQDYPGFASEMSMLLSEGYQDLLAEKLATGTGSDQPWGVFITTTTTVDVTTDNTFGAADIDTVWAALGEKFRSRATWFMNVDVENEIRSFGSGTATSRFTVDQTAGGISLLNGRPVVLSDWAPTWAGTDAAKILAVGDFSKYVVAQRVGMSVELVPHLTSTGNNRPNGTRGWYAYARVGADKSVQNAFRVLKNITT